MFLYQLEPFNNRTSFFHLSPQQLVLNELHDKTPHVSNNITGAQKINHYPTNPKIALLNDLEKPSWKHTIILCD